MELLDRARRADANWRSRRRKRLEKRIQRFNRRFNVSIWVLVTLSVAAYPAAETLALDCLGRVQFGTVLLRISLAGAAIVSVAFLLRLWAIAANHWLVRRRNELAELGGETGSGGE